MKEESIDYARGTLPPQLGVRVKVRVRYVCAVKVRVVRRAASAPEGARGTRTTSKICSTSANPPSST